MPNIYRQPNLPKIDKFFHYSHYNKATLWIGLKIVDKFITNLVELKTSKSQILCTDYVVSIMSYHQSIILPNTSILSDLKRNMYSRLSMHFHSKSIVPLYKSCLFIKLCFLCSIKLQALNVLKNPLIQIIKISFICRSWFT